MMNKKCFVLLLVGFAYTAISQNLPAEYVISADGLHLLRGRTEVKGLYNDQKIRRVDITFTQSNWKSLLTQNYNSKTDIPATLAIDNKSYPGVGVRYKGQTSYQRVTTDKKSFNITLDYTDPDQNVDGYETLNFNNSYEDNSFMREVFYENITRKYGPSLKASFVHLYINGDDYGLYPHVQGLDGGYIKEWFLSNNGTRWRCERISGAGQPGQPGGGGGFGAGTSTLNYLGENISSYTPHYTLKHTELDQPWNDLVRVTRTLNNYAVVDSLNYALDVDRALWFLAKEILFGDDDSYVNKGGMDYYAYYDIETHRLTPLEYDANSVMTGQTNSWDIFLKENDTNFPLCNKLFKIPALRQRYLAHVRTMLNDLFNPTVYTATLDGYYNMIDSVVQEDPLKLMTYAQFQAGRESLKSWMNARRTYLMNNNEVKQIGTTISQAIFSSSGISYKTPQAGQSVLVQATTTGTKKAKSVYVHYGTGYDGVYTRLSMYDDGNHQDGAASDGIWGANLPGQNAGVFVRYYIEAIADDSYSTATYYPEGAEHDVMIYRVDLLASQVSDIVINEVMSANTKSVADQDGEFDDWIELYNKSANTIDISRWIMTDNPDNLDKYRIPIGTTIAPNGYLIIWADENGKQNGLHANFKISASGEPLILMDSTGLQVDRVDIPALSDDIAYARQPNGTGPFVIKAHTFNKNNDGTTPISEVAGNTNIKIYPNPVSDILSIEPLAKPAGEVSVFNLFGQKMYSKSLARHAIDVSQWPRGTYIVSVQNKAYKVLVL